MVGYLTTRPILFAALLHGLAGAACAQELRDPTRPPGVEAMAGSGDTATAGSSGLQSIVRRQGAKPQAWINGELVSAGDRVGDARVLRITENTVVLQGSSGQEILTLTPGITKTPAPANRRTSRP